MEEEFNRLTIEWIVISKRTIYVIFTSLGIVLSIIGTVIYQGVGGNLYKTSAGDSASAHGVRFDLFEGEVRVVRGTTREIVIVDNDTYLYPGDIVQTQATGRARITLADGSALFVRSNSVMIIAENVSTEDRKNVNVRVAIERGQVNVSTEQQTAKTSNTIETPLTKNKLSAQTHVSFAVKEDNSEEVRVSEGSIKSKTRDGSQTEFHAGEYVAFGNLGNIERREPLLDAPVPYMPFNMGRIQAPTGSASTVTLQWTHSIADTNIYYHIEIASSPFFVPSTVFLDRNRLTLPKLSVTDLSPGDYFWHVQAISVTGQTSEWCEPQKFTITRR